MEGTSLTDRFRKKDFDTLPSRVQVSHFPVSFPPCYAEDMCLAMVHRGVSACPEYWEQQDICPALEFLGRASRSCSDKYPSVLALFSQNPIF